MTETKRDMGHAIRRAFSIHPTVAPSDSAHLYRLCREIEDGLVESETQFSDPAWHDLDRLLLLAQNIQHAEMQSLVTRGTCSIPGCACST